MKRSNTILLVILACSISMYAQPSQKDTKSSIQQLTVFYQGAQIERITSEVALPAGQTILNIKGLEETLVENSVRAGIKGNGVIQTIVRKTDFLNLNESNEKITLLNSKMKELDQQIEDQRMKLKVYEQERMFLTTNMKLGGANTSVSVAQIKEGAAYYRLRLTEVETLILEGNRKVKKLNEEKGKISKQLGELNYRKNRPTSTLEVTVEMEKAGSCILLLDYYMPAASWRPLYDIRVEEVGEPVQLIRKASVMQWSGEEWKDVKISFSTGNPQEKQVVPTLLPWYLNEVHPVQIRGLQSKMGGVQMSQKKSRAPQMAQMEMAEEVMLDMDEFDMGGLAETVVTASKNSILEFTLPSKVNIPSDRKEYLFSIGTEEMDAAYHYQSVPKISKAAFLMATIKDWESFELVDGVANIYYEKTFIGETYLVTSMTLDSLQLSLGKDNGLVVERKAVKDYTKSRVVGSNVRKSYGYETTIRNTKSIDVNLVLEDQYPVSSNSEISVDVEESGDAKVDEVSGKVTWRMTIKPGETVKVPLKYTLKYPKDMIINL